jgi:GNAT superfamily N-acetyltransferase
VSAPRAIGSAGLLAVARTRTVSRDPHRESNVSRVTIRALDPGDLDVAGRIIYRAFASGFRRHGYTEPVPDTRSGVALAAAALGADPAGGVLLLAPSGRPVGVAFAQQCADDVFIGPLAVDPNAQGMGYGRRLLAELLDRAGDRGARLLQDAFNTISYRLYARGGFAIRETLALLITLPGGPDPGPFGPTDDAGRRRVLSLRDTTARDLPLIAEMDHAGSGVDRAALLERISTRMRGVVLDGANGPRGFACAFPGAGIWVMGPGRAGDGRTLAAIVVGLSQRCVGSRESVALFAPTSRVDLIQPLLEVGFRISHLVNLMVRGPFTPFDGAVLPVLPVDTAAVP